MTNSNTEITDSSDGFTEVGLESFDSNENNQNSPYSGDLKEQLQSGQAEIVDISVAPEEYDAYNAKDSTPEPEEPASPSDALELARISLELEKVKYAKQQALLDHQQQLIALEKEESKRSNKLSNIFKERLKDRFNLKYSIIYCFLDFRTAYACGNFGRHCLCVFSTFYIKKRIELNTRTV